MTLLNVSCGVLALCYFWATSACINGARRFRYYPLLLDAVGWLIGAVGFAGRIVLRDPDTLNLWTALTVILSMSCLGVYTMLFDYDARRRGITREKIIFLRSD